MASAGAGRRRLLLAAAGMAGFGGLGGCAPTFPRVVDVTKLARPGQGPALTRARDLGRFDRPVGTELTYADPDGMLTPGERVLLEGTGLGPEVEVRVAGIVAPVVARTDGGGIVANVPPAALSGKPVEITVRTQLGQASLTLPSRRYALFAAEGGAGVHVLDVGETLVHRGILGMLQTPGGGSQDPGTVADGEAAPPLGRIRGVVECGSRGQLAVVLATVLTPTVGQARGRTPSGSVTASSRLFAVDQAASGGPRVVGSLALGVASGPAGVGDEGLLLAAATERPQVVVASKSRLYVVDFSLPEKPVTRGALPFEPALLAALTGASGTASAVAVGAALAVDPSGERIALLPGRGSEVHLFTQGTQAESSNLRHVTTLDVAPGAGQSALRDLAFGAEGLYVLWEDGAVGAAPSIRVSVLPSDRIFQPSGSGRVSAWRTLTVPGVGMPLGLAEANGEVWVSSAQPEVIGRFSARREAAAKRPGMLFGVNGRGEGGPLLATAEAVGAIVSAKMPGRGLRLLGAACHPLLPSPAAAVPQVVPGAPGTAGSSGIPAGGPAGGKPRARSSFGVLSAWLDGQASSTFVPLEERPGCQLPSRVGFLAVQR